MWRLYTRSCRRFSLRRRLRSRPIVLLTHSSIPTRWNIDRTLAHALGASITSGCRATSIRHSPQWTESSIGTKPFRGSRMNTTGTLPCQRACPSLYHPGPLLGSLGTSLPSLRQLRAARAFSQRRVLRCTTIRTAAGFDPGAIFARE